ncbi:MAG TPA: prolyl-tRNA synthetase associated domain-containing protein [Synergistaceae bacterium]|nr:prolyl-tRNA synthetase associated domain-containing protein [Synergistaceae bacterium]
MLTKDDVVQKLRELGVAFELEEHEAVFTIEEMERLGLDKRGEVCKNLFLRDAPGKRHFLVVLCHDKQADLSTLAAKLRASRLSFASEERLQKHLGLTKGAVSPLGMLNDGSDSVEVVLDRDLASKPLVGVHPNDNTATVYMAFAELERVLKGRGRSITFVTL